MKLRMLELPEVYEISPAKFEDDRGFFSEVFSTSTMENAGLPTYWVQDNHSYSKSVNVLRGLHFQIQPKAQDKLVRVAKGSILDVAVDIRHDSPNFGKWVALVVSAKLWNQIFIPKGFAHGFLTLEPETEVLYKVTERYSPAHDRSIRWDDPSIGINWPLLGNEPIISEKDRKAPFLGAIEKVSNS
jgi:dTDP-4-dehydrorhamnose 3,5-epimerase